MPDIKVISKNRKAYFEYEIIEKYEAGIALQGTEVKSIRLGKMNISDGWVHLTDDRQAILKQVHITPYDHGNRYNHSENRERKLLLRKNELKKLEDFVQRKGFSIVPTMIYIKGQVIKVQIGVGKGKKSHDKRETSKQKDAQREIERALKKNNS